MIRDGDGSDLRPVTGWQWLWRGQFETEHAGAGYALDVDYFDLAETALLYENGTQVAVAEMPASFPVHGGRIETAMSLYGMKRVHLVTSEGERLLRPAAGTAERWRANLAQARPVLSRNLAWLSLLVLVVALLLEIPQLLETVSGMQWLEGLTGWTWTFTSPISLPGWLNVVIIVLGVCAGFERAIGLRHHWLLDE